MINILIDWKKEKPFFLQEELKNLGFDVEIFDIPNYNYKDRSVKYRIVFLYLKYLKLALRAVKNTKNDDLIICWNFTTSIALGYICKLLFKKRKIMALNIIAHSRTPIAEKLRKKIFQPVMNMKNYFISVNSEYYIDSYVNRFDVARNKFFILNDPIQSTQTIPFKPTSSYVFVGGEAQRDWETLFKACEANLNIKFICVARKKYFDSTLTIPSNVKLLFDVPHEHFYELMKESTIVTIPLKSQLPAGLIILLKAAVMNKPIVATHTPSTTNYIKDSTSGFLFKQGDYNELSIKISILYNDKKLQSYFASNLLLAITENHSHQQYAGRLIEIIRQIDSKLLDDKNENITYYK
nr:glycosyltransferase [uncultured Draconibacterium sp.]